MFDISWSEFLLIGIVALVVIGPKELPAVMRTFGQWTRKVRGMASEFQSQFQEAMREAEMTDLKQQVDDLAQGVKESVTNFDPLKDLRDNVENVGEDVKHSLAATPEPTLALPAAGDEPALPDETSGGLTPVPLETAATPAIEAPVPATALPLETTPVIETTVAALRTPDEQPAGELESMGAAALEPAELRPADKAVQTDETGRGG
ncbi:MAG: Sec-independent protein translocase protein TatB [Xanthobacteraceae bacterium]